MCLRGYQYSISACKGFVYGAMMSAQSVSCPRRFMRTYTSLRKNRELHITRADKSNALVLLDKNDYVSKMELLLGDTNVYRELSSDPLVGVRTKYNRTINRVFASDNNLKYKFKPITPRLPYMYGLVKTHKPNNPMRPIISSIGSSSYELSKWIGQLLSPYVGTISTSHIVNLSLIHI